jgi:hypothetical protein
MVNVPFRIKTNSMPRELRNFLSDAKGFPGVRIWEIPIAKIRSTGRFEFLKNENIQYPLPNQTIKSGLEPRLGHPTCNSTNNNQKLI